MGFRPSDTRFVGRMYKVFAACGLFSCWGMDGSVPCLVGVLGVFYLVCMACLCVRTFGAAVERRLATRAEPWRRLQLQVGIFSVMNVMVLIHDSQSFLSTLSCKFYVRYSLRIYIPRS